jgi:hypothetical protein
MVHAHLPVVRALPARTMPISRLLVVQRRRAAGSSFAGLVYRRSRVRRGCGFVEFGAPALLGAVAVERPRRNHDSSRFNAAYRKLIMLNGCSFCLDLYTRNARKFGRTERAFTCSATGGRRAASRCISGPRKRQVTAPSPAPTRPRSRSMAGALGMARWRI